MAEFKKFILDACCGGRHMWVNKHHPNTIYIDIRREEKGVISQRPNFEVQPDIIMDFRKLNFPNNSFRLVVWDPPHGTAFSPTSIIAKKYGCLSSSWKSDLALGFKEIWRVLDDYGVLIFKWSDVSIPASEILKLFSEPPLFQNLTAGSKNREAKGNRSYWFCFMKIPGYSQQTVLDNAY